MAETKSMRVVPSGKIYRQMFEAQVQLNRSLTKIPRETTSLKTSKAGTAIPIVRLSKGEVEHGLLGERQRTWADGFPNDPYVENPVVYKQYAEFVGSQMRELDRTVEGREVRGLPDVVAPAKEQSNIIERIAESRRKRHEASVEEMHQELSVINSEIEPMIADACETLMKKLEEDGMEITAVLARFESDEDLLNYSLEGLHMLWEDVQCHSDVRQEWIQELDTWLSNTEEDRMHMIKRVFKDYAKALEKIAHVLLPDLQRFMDKESQLINQTVLSNRRAYGDLFVRLMSSDIEREKTQHILWKRRVDDWKMLKTELAIKRFKHFMQDEKVVSPDGAQKVLNYMIKEQEILNDKRLELINQLRDLNPPSSTKTAVYHWNKGVQDITQEIDTTNQLHLASLHKEYESVCQNCLDEIEAIKRELVETGVCSESRAKTVVEEFMIPLVGDRQRIYENNLETMEKALEEENKTSSEQLKSLFKFAQGAAHVWDVHEIGLARQERALQEKLEQCRQQHDNQNQDKEAHLDIIMDRMRQDATEKALKDSLTKALEMLEKIRHAYEVFHRDQTGIVKQYPDMVRGELKNYDDALCQLFMVDRNNPLDREPEEGSDLDQEEDEVEEEDVQRNAGESSLRKSQKNLHGAKSSKRQPGKIRFTAHGYSQYSSKMTTCIKYEERDDNCQDFLSINEDTKMEPEAEKDEVEKPTISPVIEDTAGTGKEDAIDFEKYKDEPQTSESPGDDKPVEETDVGQMSGERSCDGAEMIEDEGGSQNDSSGIDVNVEDRNSAQPSHTDQALHESRADLTQSLTGVENKMFINEANEQTELAEKLEDNDFDMGIKEYATDFPVDLAGTLDEANDEPGQTEDGNGIEMGMKGNGTGIQVDQAEILDEAYTEPEQTVEGNYVEIGLKEDAQQTPVDLVGALDEAIDEPEQTEGNETEMDMKENATDITVAGTLDEVKDEPEQAADGNDMETGMNIAPDTADELTKEQEADSAPEAIKREDSNGADSLGSLGGASSILNEELMMLEDKRETSSAENSNTGSVLGSDNKGKKKATRPAQKKDAAKDMPTAVNEVLSTNKGTMFYVVTVAGEHGIPAEKDGSKDKSKPASTAFMTEVSGLSEDSKPEYLKQIDVPESLLIEIKKIIRMNFLNHLEDWTDQASERAASVVVAKCEELNSELDLRLHLHKPRSRRAEYDVHNVRAAELVMHSERVTRHCKGIQQALTEVRNRFTNMTNEHNDLATKFRQEIEALEVVFINATKASRLYGLKNQLNVELDKFMSIIRASLRQFRQHLDETLQMLRESNARFIKSFRVFSDGGNFCPEEIDEYRKRLDKMASNIDKSEGAIMSDLEDMESKRLEQATKVAMEFEDRFKSHMFDLIFMEKIARWLTNTQVKIKAEVAKSNSQAQRLSQHLLDIDRRVDACERPNLDKEQITPEQLNDSLKGVFDAFQNRSEFLNCLKDQLMRPPSGQMQGPPGLGARVGFVQDLGPTPISKAGKQPSEDPSVGVIKTIMKSNKSKLRFGLEADLDGEFTQTGERDKLKSALSTNTSSDRGKAIQSRHGPSPGQASTNEGTVRKAQSAAASTSSATKTDSWSRRASKPAKFEKKAVIFGEGMEDEENCTHFLGIIKGNLKEALDGLLSASEMYYRQKGSRAVTRPQALQETFELCSDVLIQKLQSYYQQADEYHNQCLQEFRSQLTQLEKAVAHVPSLVTSEVLKEQISKTETSRTSCEAQFTSTLTGLRDRQKEHEQMLRPALGHPHQKDKLAALCQLEVERHNEYVEDVEKHTRVLQESAVSHASEFVEAMARLSENELLQFDNMLVVDDVVKGRVAPAKYPTTELIRRKNAGEPLEDDEDKGALPRGKNVWQGIPNNEMVSGETPAKVQLTASVTTAKTTLGHSAVVKARDQCYQDYKIQFEKTLQQIEDEKQKLMVAEQRWLDSWNTSVDKVKMLY